MWFSYRQPECAQAHAGHGQSRILTTRPENHVSYIITARFADGRIERLPAIGDLGALLDAAYAGGAMGVTAIARPGTGQGLPRPL